MEHHWMPSTKDGGILGYFGKTAENYGYFKRDRGDMQEKTPSGLQGDLSWHRLPAHFLHSARNGWLPLQAITLYCRRLL